MEEAYKFLNKLEILFLIEGSKIKGKVNEVSLYYIQGNGWNDWDVFNSEELLKIDKKDLWKFYIKNRN